MRRALARLLLGAVLLSCAPRSNAPRYAQPAGVQRLGRPLGMPIGTGGTSSASAELDAVGEPAPAELRNGGKGVLPQFAAATVSSAVDAPPCSGCVELQVDVSDINQRDEFVINVAGRRLTRVVWTLLVNFNSDQLAVQPFVDGAYGKYTSLHVNTFPLATSVEVVQELQGSALTQSARHVGLKVGSSGAWTGNQTMSVFVAELRIEGPGAARMAFEEGTEGLEPRTRARNPRVVFHPPARATASGGAR